MIADNDDMAFSFAFFINWLLNFVNAPSQTCAVVNFTWVGMGRLQKT